MKKTFLWLIAVVISFVILIGLYHGANFRENNNLVTVEGVVTDKSYDLFHTRFGSGYKFYVTAEYQSLTLDKKPTTKTAKFQVTYETYLDINIGDTVVMENPNTLTDSKIISYEKQSTPK